MNEQNIVIIELTIEIISGIRKRSIRFLVRFPKLYSDLLVRPNVFRPVSIASIKPFKAANS